MIHPPDPPAGLLPDILAPDLAILFVGFNPGLRSAATGGMLTASGSVARS